MPFSVGDFNDLVRLLDEHPQWRLELRRRLVSEDLEALPGIVRDLAEAQRRTEERLAILEQRMAELAEAQRRTEERLDAFERRTLDSFERLTNRLDALTVKVGAIDGDVLEMKYERKAPAYFGRWLRRLRLMDRNQLWDDLESRLPPQEAEDALLADLLVEGRLAGRPDRPEVQLIVEVSAIVDENDVERVIRRAGLFRRAGYSALPVVAGRDLTASARDLAEARGVAVLRNGGASFWEETLAQWPVG